MIGALFRHRCIRCGQQRGAGWCLVCRDELIHQPIVPLVRHAPSLDGVVSSGAYDSLLGEAVRSLKYEGERALARLLAARLPSLITDLTGGLVDFIVPVPMHAARQRERGYNQSALVGEQVAWALGVDFNADGLVRVRETAPQVGLDAAGRHANLTGAFSALGIPPEVRCVVIIDDVMTTGATLSECARALRYAGVQSVYGAVVADAT
jgi:ComF family protein